MTVLSFGGEVGDGMLETCMCFSMPPVEEVHRAARIVVDS